MAAPGTFILRRGSTLVFRRRAPACVARVYQKKFFAFSLRTHLISEARRRAALAARFTDDLIGLIEACGAGMLDERNMDAVVDDLMRFEIEAAEELREISGPRSPDAVTAAIRLHEATRDTLRAALVYGDYGALHAPIERTIARLGVDLTPGCDGFQRLARRAARGLLEVTEENIRREHGIYVADARLAGALATSVPQPAMVAAHPLPVLPAVPMGDGPPALLSPASMPVPCPPPAQHAPRPATRATQPAAPVAMPVEGRTNASFPGEKCVVEPPVAAPRLAGTREDRFFVDVNALTPESPISDWFAAAITEKRTESPGWDTNNLGNWRSTIKLITEAFGDRPLCWFTQARMLEFRSLLLALPKNHHKSSEARGFYDIIEEAETKEAEKLALAENEIFRAGLSRGDAETARARAMVPRLRVGTVYRHNQAILFVFRLAAGQGCADMRVMKNVLWTNKQLEKLKMEEKDTSRLAWGDKLDELLGSTAFVSPCEGEVHTVFWPTLIAAHAGLRMEEALQLKTCDIDSVDGIAVFRIQSGEGQHLKSDAAKRIVPIHQNLIDLGFLAMVEEHRRRGREWLFPEIERCAAKNRLSGTFTKVFTHYRITAGIYDPRRDFHSLRTNFNVILKRKKCPLEIRKRLIGHELRDVTEEHYDPEGSPIAEFNEWVQGIRIDVSHIVSPWRLSKADTGNVVSLRAKGLAAGNRRVVVKSVSTGAARRSGKSTRRPR